MSDNSKYVVVGGGLAGAKAVQTLREEGFDGSVVLLAAEATAPYERPALSKGYLLGKDPLESTLVHPPGWYADHDVDLRLRAPAVRVDRVARTVKLGDDSLVPYDALLLATGSTPRPLAVPGAASAEVHYLRTAQDSQALREALAPGARHVVVAGAGWIGLEVAAAARSYGNDVVVLEPAPTPLFGPLGPEMGEVFAALHRDHDVDLRAGTGVSQVESGSGGAVVVDTAGARHPADVLVAGLGVSPITLLASGAGLAVDNGVVVDAALRSTDHHIWAAGDIARAWNPIFQRHLRVEHWANALNSGPLAARAMLGQDVVYDRVPYFYSDQYDLGMEYAGHGEGYARVVTRGDVAGREFVAFWLDREDRVLAGMNVNVWDVMDAIQALVRAQRPVDVARLTDPAVALADLAADG